MKKVYSKLSSFILAGTMVLAFGLLLVSVFLYNHYRTYQVQNRQLILQNDSIMSVNIELQQALQRKESSLGNYSSIEINSSNTQ